MAHPDFPDTLIRFRVNPVAVFGDIAKPEIFYDFCEEIDVKSAKTKVLVYQVYRPDGWCYIKPIFVISTLLKHLTGNIQYLRQ